MWVSVLSLQQITGPLFDACSLSIFCTFSSCVWMVFFPGFLARGLGWCRFMKVHGSISLTPLTWLCQKRAENKLWRRGIKLILNSLPALLPYVDDGIKKKEELFWTTDSPKEQTWWESVVVFGLEDVAHVRPFGWKCSQRISTEILVNTWMFRRSSCCFSVCVWTDEHTHLPDTWHLLHRCV